MCNFNQQDVLDLEQVVISSLPADTRMPTGYFKEPVAQALYHAWREDSSDTRLLVYAFPLINSLMVKYMSRLKVSPLEQGEIFNTLAIHVLESFQRYNQDRGRLFTFLTIFVTFRILDLLRGTRVKVVQLEDWDTATDDSSFHILEDFKGFVRKLKSTQGGTANRMLDALLDLLEGDEPVAARPQKHLIGRISQMTALPVIIVEPYFQVILSRFAHSVLD